MLGTLIYLGIGVWVGLQVQNVALGVAQHDAYKIRGAVALLAALVALFWGPLVAAYWARYWAGRWLSC